MLSRIFTQNKGIQSNKDYFYSLKFPSHQLIIHSPVPFSEDPVWRLVLGLKEWEPISKAVFHEPILFNGFTFEKKDFDWLISKLSGLKNVEKGKELDFIFTKLSSNFFSILNLDQILDSSQIQDMVQYMLSNRLFSYQMIFTLFNLLEQKIPVSSLVSKRVYQTFLEEIEPFKESLENDRNWELLTVFISNYHFHDFLKEKHAFPVFFDFLEKIRKTQIDASFSKGELSKLIRQTVDPKELISFFAQIPDLSISRAFDSLEWENFKPYVSSRTYERIKEDIWQYYETEKSYASKIILLRSLIEFLIQKTPPFFFFNKSFELKTTLNLVYDRIGPVYMAIAIKENEVLQKNILPYLTPFRRTFIEKMLEGKIKKRGGISNQEKQTSQQSLNFYLAAALLLKNTWFLLD